MSSGRLVGEHTDRDLWLAQRKDGIGGSDVAAIFGEHPYKSALDVYLDKMSGATGEDLDNPDIQRGRWLEEPAVKLYQRQTGRQVRRHNLRRHAKYPFLLASIDRQILAEPGAHPTGALEIKCPRSQTFMKIMREGLPDYIILQGQHQALVLDYEWTGFGIFGADHFRLLDFDVERDKAISERIIEVCGNWWHEHVLAGKPPIDNAPKPDLGKLPEVKGEVTRRTDPEFLQAAEDYFMARELEEEASAIKKAARDQLEELLGLGVFEDAAGDYRFYVSERAGRKQFQKKRLEALRPMAAAEVARALDELGIEDVPAAMETIEELALIDLDGGELNTLTKGYTDVRGYRLTTRTEE